MRRLASLFLAVAALGACAPYYSPGGPYDRDRGRYDDDGYYGDGYYGGAPLDARIVPGGGFFGVRLSDDAHVAIFEIVPGRGVGLLYPSYESERGLFRAGHSNLHIASPRYYDWYFANNATSPYGRVTSEPRFFFMVASRRPLRNIGRFQRSPGALRSLLGLSSYASLNTNTVMNDLVSAVVPAQPDEDWTTDMYAIWPERRSSGYYRDDRRYVEVRCANGRTVFTALELARYACRTPRERGPAPPVRPGRPGGGSTEVTHPGRKRPESTSTDAPPAGRRAAPASRRGGGDTPARAPRSVEPRREEPRHETAPARVAPRREESDEPRRAEPRREEPRREEAPRRAEPREVSRPEPREVSRPEPRSEPREVSRPEPRSEPSSSGKKTPPRS